MSRVICIANATKLARAAASRNTQRVDDRESAVPNTAPLSTPPHYNLMSISALHQKSYSAQLTHTVSGLSGFRMFSFEKNSELPASFSTFSPRAILPSPIFKLSACNTRFTYEAEDVEWISSTAVGD